MSTAALSTCGFASPVAAYHRTVSEERPVRLSRRAYVPLVALLCVGGACQNRVRPRVQPSPSLSLVITQIPLDGLRKIDTTFPGNLTPPVGSRLVRIVIRGRSVERTVLTPGFAAAADPCVLFSSDSLLFAGKRMPDEPWNVWRVPLTGDPITIAPEQVTNDMGDCREPFYMPLSAITPPEFNDKVRWIGFTSTAAGTFDERGTAPATAFYAQSLDTVCGRGIVTWRTTFNLNHDFSPSMLADGRVVFSSRQHGQDEPPQGIVGLVTTNWDGTELNSLFGVQGGASVKSMACEFPEVRTVVFVESDGTTQLNAGRLARVRVARPLGTHEVISNAPGLFLTPHALPDGRMLVSYARDGADFGIYWYDQDAKRLGPALFDDPDWADIDPQVVVPHPEPQGRITIVVDSKDVGDVQCLNVYDTDLARMRRIARGDVKAVRFVEGVPRRTAASLIDTMTGWPRVRIIGEAPVEDDGSFSVYLPADTPFLCQLLDADGLAVVSMRSWTWIRRGAQYGCMGCHENRELAPENRVTKALLRQPSNLTTPPGARRTVDFRHDVGPIIARSCAGCHGTSHPTGLNLADGAPEQVYARLVVGESSRGLPLVRPGYARESVLAWRVMGRRLDGAAEALRPMPPRDRLADGELRAICEWIDLGAQFDNRERSQGLTSDGRDP